MGIWIINVFAHEIKQMKISLKKKQTSGARPKEWQFTCSSLPHSPLLAGLHSPRHQSLEGTQSVAVKSPKWVFFRFTTKVNALNGMEGTAGGLMWVSLGLCTYWWLTGWPFAPRWKKRIPPQFFSPVKHTPIARSSNCLEGYIWPSSLLGISLSNFAGFEILFTFFFFSSKVHLLRDA